MFFLYRSIFEEGGQSKSNKKYPKIGILQFLEELLEAHSSDVETWMQNDCSMFGYYFTTKVFCLCRRHV